MNDKQVILAGANGFLGKLLSKYLSKLGYEITALTRQARQSESDNKEVLWDGRTLGAWTEHLKGALAVINLSGRSVNCRYTEQNKRAILDSRLDSTRVLGQAIAGCSKPPAVWLNSSTATIYKHSVECAMDEHGEIGATPEADDAFSVQVAQEWERAFESAPTPATRKVALRTAMVFGTQAGGVLDVFHRLVLVGLGGQMATGKQYVSWIHEEDFCHAIDWLISKQEFRGPVNLSAPNPIPNRELMATLRRISGKTFGLPATRWMLHIGAFFMRTETELIIKSRRVVPGRLLESGFDFRFPRLEKALADLLPRMEE